MKRLFLALAIMGLFAQNTYAQRGSAKKQKSSVVKADKTDKGNKKSAEEKAKALTDALNEEITLTKEQYSVIYKNNISIINAKVATRTPGDDGFDKVSYSDEDEEVAAATKAAGSDTTAKELGNTPEEKKVKFNQFLASVNKNKDDKAKIDAILKLAKDKFKFSGALMNDLRRAAGRKVEA